MSEENKAAGQPPAATQSPAQNPPAAAPAPNVGEPDWLNQRIGQAKTNAAAEAQAKLLTELGAANIDEAKAFVAAAKAKADAEKSAETRAAELKAKLDAESSSKDATLAVVREHSARMMIGLTAEQQAAVKAIAGEDPVKTLATIGALAPTWAKAASDKDAASAAAQSAAKAAAEKSAPPANTAPPASAPNGAAPPAANPRAQYEQMRAVNPYAAAYFGNNNPEAYKK